MRILYVENHETFAQQVCKSFLSAHEILIVPTIASALSALSASTWDVALIDYDLDDGKGVQLVADLAQRSSRPFMVAVSAYEDRNDEMNKAGAGAVCGKLNFGRIEEVLRGLRA